MFDHTSSRFADDIKRIIDDDGKGIKGKPHPLFEPDVLKPKPKPSGPIAVATFSTVDECTHACVALSGTRYMVFGLIRFLYSSASLLQGTFL